LEKSPRFSAALHHPRRLPAKDHRGLRTRRQTRNLLLDPYFQGEVDKLQTQWRKVIATAALQGVPAPCMGSALSYYDGYRSEKLPPTCCKGSATTSARTPTSAPTIRAASSFTSTAGIGSPAIGDLRHLFPLVRTIG